ncbi:4Fe-4S dicluster domain-containing protein [Hoyosella sp. YIM 151337]|uniref:4Fe-4S dicluster domain-containing protein n=1 Tax=Hoyosella sp. YIM 151337 TaxID=2992742 RepID=UPI00223681CA|nr:4Fe-4S dicluster domain-containing protein [Hoyosella sp. YIM 151337]MCW4355968.1 4Fe-4S dicluster domain-containing protein [Hoyosella sp. YIM 151337]
MPAVIDRTGLDQLVGVLRARGYRVIGPQVRDNAIVLDELESGADLPAGWGAETGPGTYRLYQRPDEAVFAHSAGPGSWKQFVHPPRSKLWEVGPDLQTREHTDDPAPLAFLGVHGCDLASLAVLRRVLNGCDHPDSAYARRTSGLFIVAVNCTEPGQVCFCASMGTGPSVATPYDLALTEHADADRHWFLAETGSEIGADVLADVPSRAAAATETEASQHAVAAAANKMGRAMPSVDLPALMRTSAESPHWQDVASRCLACTNCTMVCPTCFCTSAEDVTDLTGSHAQRWQRWASCFEIEFSYVHGGSVRRSTESRYRQWLTHKLGTWHDQFGSSGCVGCGRCIAWCPADIDITAEVARLAELAEQGGRHADS